MYLGALDRKKMSRDARFACEAFCGAREFISWWLDQLKTFNGVSQRLIQFLIRGKIKSSNKVFLTLRRR